MPSAAAAASSASGDRMTRALTLYSIRAVCGERSSRSQKPTVGGSDRWWSRTWSASTPCAHAPMVRCGGTTKLKGTRYVCPASNTRGTGYADRGTGMASFRSVCVVACGAPTPSTRVRARPSSMICRLSKRTSRCVEITTSPSMGAPVLYTFDRKWFLSWISIWNFANVVLPDEPVWELASLPVADDDEDGIPRAMRVDLYRAAARVKYKMRGSQRHHCPSCGWAHETSRRSPSTGLDVVCVGGASDSSPVPARQAGES
ncbi:hypothetical protein MAPG_01563 [Magnaporthiopsis poae ATCC 64411]|uniref:Uncharacterized protein n=1 Tax=Magnaporthiopsis poae (strain ATCC 64411 / 73-15) TaxID=644358 RepID=A0A0C4DP13_MAGP6|nr:hypothetical protein MAPG_01563 [Magnaporthiopsis poae ATCC 64411]